MTRSAFPFVALLGAALALPAAAAQSMTAPPPASAPVVQDTSWPPAGVFRMEDGVRPPRVVREVKPGYTAEARRADIQGLVEVEAIVNVDGTVGDVRVVQSLDKEFGLDVAAIAAVKEWTFTPGRTADGKAVPVLVNIELTFSQRKR